MIGAVQIAIVRALAAVEEAMPGRHVNVPEVATLIFGTTSGKVTEGQRTSITRALTKLASEKMISRVVNGTTTRDIGWRLHDNIIKTLVRKPQGDIDYSKRVKRLTDEGAQ
jgi:hypothetical protein